MKMEHEIGATAIINTANCIVDMLNWVHYLRGEARNGKLEVYNGGNEGTDTIVFTGDELDDQQDITVMSSCARKHEYAKFARMIGDIGNEIAHYEKQMCDKGRGSIVDDHYRAVGTTTMEG